ncbi:hypothetical protein V7183_12125 [Bacillus sp. JJ1127]|uniref:hypothetical protein n=1 Tax=Bacillus sp. JJ1127 TaxID=3122952 RepID=UPI002FFDDB39
MTINIPKQTHKVYMERDYSVSGNRYEEGRIYTVDKDVFQKLTESQDGRAAAASKCDFPSLDVIEQMVDAAVRIYERKRDELAAHPKYDDAPSLRVHELQELRKELDGQVSKLVDKYDIEMQVLQREVAEKMYTLQASQDTAYLDIATTQLQFGNPITTLQSLLFKAEQADEAGKLAILQAFSGIADKAKSHNHYSYYKADIEKKLNDLYEKASDVPTIRENERRLQQLTELSNMKDQIDLPYQQLAVFEKGGI